MPQCGPARVSRMQTTTTSIGESLKSARSSVVMMECTHCGDMQAKSRRGKGGKDKATKRNDEARNPFQVILTADQARSIYALRTISTAEDPSLRQVAGKSSLVAEMYGVSPKTIRDVWNRKTWSQVKSVCADSLCFAIQ